MSGDSNALSLKCRNGRMDAFKLILVSLAGC
ncbi:MAG: hypothetical protein ACI9MB_001493 [Verrucomicrobiales bacterium]